VENLGYYDAALDHMPFPLAGRVPGDSRAVLSLVLLAEFVWRHWRPRAPNPMKSNALEEGSP
jgi:hypothetical protein